MENKDRFKGKTVGLVVSGGNIDSRLLSSVLMRGLVREGRLVRLRIEIPDTPGALSRATGMIGDSGGNQSGMENVATALNAKWGANAAAIFIPEYYRTPPGTPNVLRDLGVVTENMPRDGLHDSPGITLNMMLDDPDSVRWAARVKTGQAVINGVSIADLNKSLEIAKAISDARAKRTAVLIRERIASRSDH